MSRSIPILALAAAILVAACADRTSPEPASDAAPIAGEVRAGQSMADAARERLARRIALALADPAFRARLRADLDRSPIREQKLHFQRYLRGSDRGALRTVARLNRDTESAVEAEAAAVYPLELYFPVPGHRARWSGDENILVATVRADGEAPVAFTTRGERLILDPRTPPATPVLSLVPVETDFDAPSGQRIVIGGSPPQTPPAGLYMTYAQFLEDFEGWPKGAPEFEVHMLGQAGSTDSLTSYSCAGERQTGLYFYNQDNLTWSGNVLLMTQAALDSYRAAHPNQNLRVFVVEDDDTACQIKSDPARFANLVKTVEAAYPNLTGGRDTTGSSLQRLWRRANALQRILKALASVIKTNDELVGNAVEGTVAGITHPSANWVIKGDNNKTNGYLKLIMK